MTKQIEFLKQSILNLLGNHTHRTVAQIRDELNCNYGHDTNLNSPIGYCTPRKQTAIIKGLLNRMVTSGDLERYLIRGQRKQEVKGYALKGQN